LDIAIEVIGEASERERTDLWLDVHSSTEVALSSALGVKVNLELYEDARSTPTLHEALTRGSEIIWEGPAP
jgi:hypothetical protein